ncbi:MAG: hypothetical protein IID15_00620 [Candidatus Marinimicrobia bacterium]|nr:hypothetical protein [Candidatus Neomarinimicrobiota bacterium]
MTHVRRSLLLIMLVVAGLLGPAASLLQGWGFPAHQRINGRAVELLPGPLGEYFTAHRNWLVALATDADRRKSYSPEESPSHYIDFEYYGSGPYDALPHNRRDAEEQFGKENLPKWGTLPWHVTGLTRSLSQAMRAGEWERVLVLSADLGHFIGDGHQPLHTTVNYDGKDSGNDGIHAMFETLMVNHYMDKYRPGEQKIIEIKHLDEAVFSWLIEAHGLLGVLLEADTKARAPFSAKEREALIVRWDTDPATLPGGYFDDLYAGAGKLAWQQMDLAAIRLASLWHWAWLEAGSPAPPT